MNIREITHVEFSSRNAIPFHQIIGNEVNLAQATEIYTESIITRINRGYYNSNYFELTEA